MCETAAMRAVIVSVVIAVAYACSSNHAGPACTGMSCANAGPCCDGTTCGFDNKCCVADGAHSPGGSDTFACCSSSTTYDSSSTQWLCGTCGLPGALCGPDGPKCCYGACPIGSNGIGHCP
jgi:hypothetical protein